MSLNKVQIIGNVGKDPEVRCLPNGEKVATLRVATTDRYTDKRTNEKKEITEWHSVIMWRKQAEICEQYVRKGTPLYIEGKLRTRQYKDAAGNDRYATEIVADTFQLLGGGRQAESGNAPAPAPVPAPAAEEEKDDLPF